MGVLSPAQSSAYQAGPPGANVHFYPSHPFILSSLTLLLLTPFTMLLPGPTMLSDADSIESRPPLGHPSATVATGVYRRTQSVDATASSSPQSAVISVFACESIIFFTGIHLPQSSAPHHRQEQSSFVAQSLVC